MTKVLTALVLLLLASPSARAFDATTEAITDRYKAGKLVAENDVAHLMQSAQRWCYDRSYDTCAWSEIYLEVTGTTVIFELSNAWDAELDYAMTDTGVFRDGRICQSGADWLPSLQVTRRSDGTAISGRALHDLRLAMGEARPDLETYDDCFDYLYLSADADSEVVTLLQRQFVDGRHEAANDVEVSIHFNAADAAALALRP